MSNKPDATPSRREFLKLAGGSAVLIPLAGLHGCSGEPAPEAPPAPAAPPAATQAPAPAPAPPPAPKPADAAMAKLDPANPQAQSLAYVHDASKVDRAKHARYQPGQLCENCALFQPKGDEEWAPCSIFPGKLVNAKGWCNVYAPKG